MRLVDEACFKFRRDLARWMIGSIEHIHVSGCRWCVGRKPSGGHVGICSCALGGTQNMCLLILIYFEWILVDLLDSSLSLHLVVLACLLGGLLGALRL